MVNTIKGKQIAVRVTDEEMAAFKKKVEDEGKTVSEVLLQFIHNYLGYNPHADTEDKTEELEAKIEAKLEAKFEARIQQLEEQVGKLVA